MRSVIVVLLIMLLGLPACKKETPFQYNFTFKIGTRQYIIDSVFALKTDSVYFSLINYNKNSPVLLGLTASTFQKRDDHTGLYFSLPATGAIGTVQTANFLVILDSTDKNNGNYLPGKNFSMRILQDDGNMLTGTFSGDLSFSGSRYGNTGQSSNTISDGQFSVLYKK